MNKTFTKILSVALVLVMVVSMFAITGFAATEQTVVQYGKAGGYLAIGDSIGRGCGSDGFYMDRDIAADGGQYDIYTLRNVEGSYPYLVAQAVGCEAPADITDQNATYWPLTYPGMTTAVALDVLGVDDNYSDTRLNYSYYNDVLKYFGYEGSSTGARGEAYVEGECGLCGNPIELIQQADLITVELGMCDIFYRAYRIISKGGFLADGLKFDVSSLESIKELLSTAVALLQEGYDLWAKNYPMMIERILELNPDATVVMVGSFNMVNQLTLLDETQFPLGSLFSVITDKMNKQYEQWAKQYNILYADITNTETLATESDWSVLGDFLKNNNSFAGSHPSQNGHDYIARQILAQLPEKEDTKNIVVDLGRFDKVDKVVVNGITVKNYDLTDHVLTVPYSGPLASSLKISLKNDDGTVSVQYYKLSYNSETGYSAYRVYGNNDIAGFFKRPFELIKKLFELIGKLFKK